MQDNRRKRDSKGRFLVGGPGGPGRPRRSPRRLPTEALSAACSPADWLTIVTKAVAQAKAGDPYARAWLLELMRFDGSLLTGTRASTTQPAAIKPTPPVRPPAADRAFWLGRIAGQIRTLASEEAWDPEPVGLPV